MTALDALRRAVDECQRFRYRAEPPGQDRWQTPAETEALGEGDCEDMAVWTIARVWDLAAEAHPGITLDLVAGALAQGGHAWVAMTDADGRVWWADPTPGPGDPPVHTRSWFRSYTPEYAYRYDGTTFSMKFAYEEPR